MTRKTLTALTIGTALLSTLLAGCTSTDDRTSDETTTTSSTPTPRTAEEQAMADHAAEVADPSGECKDGIAILAGADSFSLPEGCADVSVLAQDATIDLGPVEHLVIEGSGNTITADSITSIDSISTGNTVTYGGDADATINELGSDNTYTRD